MNARSLYYKNKTGSNNNNVNHQKKQNNFPKYESGSKIKIGENTYTEVRVKDSNDKAYKDQDGNVYFNNARMMSKDGKMSGYNDRRILDLFTESDGHVTVSLQPDGNYKITNFQNSEDGGYRNKKEDREYKAIRWDPTGGFDRAPYWFHQLGYNYFKTPYPASGEEQSYWAAYLGIDNEVPTMKIKNQKADDGNDEHNKILEGKPTSDFFGTTDRMDQYIQVFGDTLNLGKIIKDYDNYKKKFPTLRELDEIKNTYNTGKEMMENPNKWVQATSPAIAELSVKETGETDPIGMLQSFGIKWNPEKKEIQMHDAYDFPKFQTCFTFDRPRTMKIRGAVKFDPQKGSYLLRNRMENFNNIARPIIWYLPDSVSD